MAAMSGLPVFGCRPGLPAQDAPLHVRAEVFAPDRAGRGSLDQRALLGRYWPLAFAPLIDCARSDQQQASHTGLPSHHLTRPEHCWVRCFHVATVALLYERRKAMLAILLDSIAI